VTVVHFHRKPFPGSFSIEGLFANLRAEMQRGGLAVEHCELPWHSKGLWPRVRSALWAKRRQGAVNHITGDVHFLALGLAPERTILTVHDLQMLERLKGLRRWVLKLFWFELPLRRARVVTVISQCTRDELIRQFPFCLGKVVVVPDAVSLLFQPRPKPLNGARPRILQVGTKANKNLPRLFEAVEGLDCTLHLVGRLSSAHRAELAARRIDSINDERLDDAAMYQAYCDADMLSFVSTSEGFGMPILEAQWVERPIVASNCSAAPEVAGAGACLVNPFDPADIRRGIERVISDEEYREQIVAAGRENRRRFELASVAQQYVSLYEELAGNTGAIPR
jgi:glycosyltransferase involved in cell wall biosynthesis